MRVTITGGSGFLGWHVRVLIRALGWPEPTLLDRRTLAEPGPAAAAIGGADVVLHLAGANRGDPATVAAANVTAAGALAQAVRRCAVPPARVVFANSIQAGNGTPYGDSKAAAGATLAAASQGVTDFRDVRLPNVYGEHGRPHYNSVVATFCRSLAEGVEPEIHEDRRLTLVHATDAAAGLLDVPAGGPWDGAMPAVRTSVRDLAARLTRFATTYRRGEIPDLDDRHDVRLFNTYRSHCFPAHAPITAPRHSDHRGDLVEAVKAHGGAGQTFWSTTRPGVVRGDHFHLAKMERFAVVRGQAVIRLRRVGFAEVVEFPVTGDAPVLVDMPAMWAHSITNIGADELVTLFWANEVFDPARPDTFREPVDVEIREPVEVRT